jgi:hypothetical protein
MFNDLNNQANPNHQAVDDIFAETDKPATNGIQSDIETHNVGLASTGESMPGTENEQIAEKRNYLKIIIIVTLVLAVIGGVYLAYSKFFKGNGNAEVSPVVDNQKATTTDTATANTTTPSKPVEDNFVAAIPGIATTSVNPIATATSSEVGTTSPIGIATVTPAVSTIDSDKDGLTDEEEKAAGTNINVIDTDNDGLSDYEEVKIYHTNPLSADTDGDGYLDGAEVKNGYNPNGPGKLPGNSAIK